MHLSMYKAKSLTGGTYTELPNINEVILNIKVIDMFCRLW